MKLPDPIQNIVQKLSELPSIGPRQAIRLAFYLVASGKEEIKSLADATAALRDIKICERCFFIHQNKGALCDICANSHRAQNVVMVVEKETDLISLENTGKFTGRYFVIGEIPKAGLLEEGQKLRLASLKAFIQKKPPEGLGGKAEEIILAFNPTAAGDLQASLLTKELAPLTKKLSRLGRGLPTGGEIEFADDGTLSSALEGRS
jgi:recombination protein RecR